MDFHRRVGAGRLSEVVGSKALDVDMYMRRLGLYSAAKAAYGNLDQESKAIVDSYVLGVNA